MTLDALAAFNNKLPESSGIIEEQPAHRLMLQVPASLQVSQLRDIDVKHDIARSSSCAWLRLDKR